jgi:hypothetical protein
MRIAPHDRRDLIGLKFSKILYFFLKRKEITFSMLWIQIGLEVNFKFTSKRSEPSSRNFLIGEQPNPWKLLHLQDKLSRHRGAELRRRYERLGGTSLFIICMAGK